MVNGQWSCRVTDSDQTRHAESCGEERTCFSGSATLRPIPRNGSKRTHILGSFMPTQFDLERPNSASG